MANSDILIVEDGKLERERLSTVLGEAGYRVTAVSSVQAAEQALENEGYRLIILDIGLGDRSGSYLFSSLQQRQRESAVIIFTGNPSPHLRQRFLEEGADDFIVKGSRQASSENILARVRALLGDASSKLDSQGESMDLEEFLRCFVPQSVRDAYYDQSGKLWPCAECGSLQYEIYFPEELQAPPELRGKVRCAVCQHEMDPEIA